MGAVIFIALLVVPFVELWILLQVSGSIGVPETILLLILISLAGAWLLKQQGLATWERLNAALGRGEIPTNEVMDGALILFGGAPLLTPGFLSDAVGILFLLPPTRAGLRRVFRRLLLRFVPGARSGARIYTTTATRVSRRHDDVSQTPEALPGGASEDEAGSPDRG